MAIYAIGDVQGCYDELARLLDKLNIDPADDEVWFVGDLVNRGPRSLDTLRLLASMGSMAKVTLGNHDLHLLATAEKVRSVDRTFAPILKAKDSKELLKWLRNRPLAYFRPKLNTLMVHAGVPATWTVKKTLKYAEEVEEHLRGPNRRDFFADMYGDTPNRWSSDLKGKDRRRFIVNALTRMRFVDKNGGLNFDQSGPPHKHNGKLMPWFDAPGRKTSKVRIVCGHWSALGLLRREDILAIDTGCVWGRELTAVRLDGEERIYSVRARG